MISLCTHTYLWRCSWTAIGARFETSLNVMDIAFMHYNSAFMMSACAGQAIRDSAVPCEELCSVCEGSTWAAGSSAVISRPGCAAPAVAGV